MKKLSIIVLAILLLFSSCNMNIENKYVMPTWLQGNWNDESGEFKLSVSESEVILEISNVKQYLIQQVKQVKGNVIEDADSFKIDLSFQGIASFYKFINTSANSVKMIIHSMGNESEVLFTKSGAVANPDSSTKPDTGTTPDTSTKPDKKIIPQWLQGYWFVMESNCAYRITDTEITKIWPESQLDLIATMDPNIGSITITDSQVEIIHHKENGNLIYYIFSNIGNPSRVNYECMSINGVLFRSYIVKE